MNYISKERFKELANVRAPHCISIYMPTEVEHIDANKIMLKNCLKEVTSKLETYELKSREISKVNETIEGLINDVEFWRNRSNGLALYYYDNKLESYFSDEKFTQQTYVGDHLNLVQLVSDLDKKKEFYLLVLGENNIRFFKGSNDQLNEHNILPESLEDVVGSDYEQKALQYRSGQGETGGGMYHGQGSGGDSEKKRELKKLFEEIDENLMAQVETSSEIPLIIASEERSFHLYKSVNNYDGMLDKPIQGNHEETKESELHERSLKMLREQPNNNLKNLMKSYNSLLNKGESSSDIDKIVAAAYNGQINTLFVKENTNLYGHYNLKTGEVDTHKEESINNADLANFSAVHTILKDGRVFVLEGEEMPDSTSPLNAIFRYEVVTP
ncbi:baeRF7 domain-containing protein [Fulvivirga lutea]|uniref:Uncharacterized protein n=1 Tax=Fulvivirga lutea TaxID=2810512 RepID=A0A974WF74_9BACT|nr:hypothetical protein [Fulvivirga lutea]QSE95897.1 hypothetical protein JR347_09715 [Fulvivirga lutea]